MSAAPSLLVMVAATGMAACSASHALDAEMPLDGAAPVSDRELPADRSMDLDGALDASSGSESCTLLCSVSLLAAGYRPEGSSAFMEDGVEILAAVASPEGALHVLLAPAPNDTGAVGRRWLLATAPPGETSFSIGGGRTWPVSPGPGTLDGAGNGLDAAVLRASGSSVRAIVLFTVRAGVGASSMDVRVARIEWSSSGSLRSAAQVGTIATLAQPAAARGTAFELPGGDVMAAVEHAGIIEGMRLSWGGAGTSPRRVHIDVGASAAGGDALAPLSGVALDDETWLLVGGGRSETDLQPAFAHAIVSGEASWSGTLDGDDSDPAPLVVRSADSALALRWQQNLSNVDDTMLVISRLTDHGLARRFAIPTPRLPLPLDAQVSSADAGAVAVWSVRAPDVLGDTLVYAALVDRSAECAATQAVSLARLPGAGGAPSVYVVPTGDDFVVLGQPSAASGTHALTALRARCVLGAE